MKYILPALIGLLLVPVVSFAQTTSFDYQTLSTELQILVQLNQLETELQTLLNQTAQVGSSVAPTTTVQSVSPYAASGTYTATNGDGSITQYVTGQAPITYTPCPATTVHYILGNYAQNTGESCAQTCALAYTASFRSAPVGCLDGEYLDDLYGG